MAIDYNAGITSIDAGAPDIKYIGDEGPKSPQEEMQIAGREYNRVLEILEKVRENIPLSEEEKEELQGLIKTLTAKGVPVEQLMGEEQNREGIMQMASNDTNERVLEQIFEQLLEEGFSPEEAAIKAREMFDQSMATGGRVGYAGGQLVKRNQDGSRPGYRGDAAYRSASLQADVDPSQRGTATRSEVGDGKRDRDEPTIRQDAPPEVIEDLRQRELAEADRKTSDEDWTDVSETGTGTGTDKEESWAPWKQKTSSAKRYIAYLKSRGVIIPDWLEEIDESGARYLTKEQKNLLNYGWDPNDVYGPTTTTFVPGQYNLGGGDPRRFSPITMDYKDWKASGMDSRSGKIGNFGLLSRGDLGNLKDLPNPGTVVNPETGMPFTDFEWDQHKRRSGQGASSYDRGPSLEKSIEDRMADPADPGDPADPDPDPDIPIDPVTGLPLTSQYFIPGASNFYSNLPASMFNPTTNMLTLADGGRAGYAGGGIADLRQGYFLGKLVKGLTKPFKGLTRGFKKIMKSPAGKMAMLAALGYGTGMFGGGQGLAGLRQSLIGSAATGAKAMPGPGALFKPGTTGWLGKAFLKPGATEWSLANISPLKSILMSMGIGGLTALTGDKDDEPEWLKDWKRRHQAGLVEFEPIGQPETWESIRFADGGRTGYAGGGYNDDDDEEDHRSAALSAMYGMRRRAQEGGLMDLGGMEKDYRNEGGFVPIGGEERADDVPARLSKNEFVFTADAVRNAGGGDIDKGAEIMENLMENLEKGGKVSEESQGLEGARDMFATAQRLEGVM